MSNEYSHNSHSKQDYLDNGKGVGSTSKRSIDAGSTEIVLGLGEGNNRLNPEAPSYVPGFVPLLSTFQVISYLSNNRQCKES
jgi:hypothetical protein